MSDEPGDEAPAVKKSRSVGSSITKVITPSGAVRWRVRFDAGPAATGKRRQRSRTYAKKAEAVKAQTAFREAVNKGEFVDNSKRTVASLVAEWMPARATAKQWRPSTRYQAESATRPILELIGNRFAQSLTEEAMVDLRDRLLGGEGRPKPTGSHRPKGEISRGKAQPRSAKTVNTSLQLLSACLDWAKVKKYVNTNPLRGLDPLRARPRGEFLYWSADQLRAFLAAAEQDELAPAWFLSAAGLRRGEVIGARWSDVDLKAGTVAVARAHVLVGGDVVEGDPKSELSWRTVPLDARAVEVLRAAQRMRMKDGTLTEQIATWRDGTSVKPDLYSAAFRALSEHAGLPVIRLHSLRGTLTTIARERGVDVFSIAAVLGHSELVSITNYTGHNIGPKRAAVEAITSAVYGA